MKLLGFADSSPKLKGAEADGIEGAIMYLASHTQSGFNVCASATKGCADVCLMVQGRGRMDSVRNARIRKTRMYFEQRDQFLEWLVKDIASVERRAIKKNLDPVVRLNGTSDIRWELHEFMKDFPDVQFYDYTKHRNRKDLPENYQLTFSRSEESTTKDLDTALNNGMNIAVVFQKELPETWYGLPVIDGTLNDWRFRDPNPCIVGLVAKGSAKKDMSGFVIRQ